jgi:hypothetical protein
MAAQREKAYNRGNLPRREGRQVYPGVGRQARHGRGEGDAAFSPPAAPAPPVIALPIVFLAVRCRGNIPADVLKPPRADAGIQKHAATHGPAREQRATGRLLLVQSEEQCGWNKPEKS